MSSLDALNRLTVCLARLPGIGRKSAERMALRLVRERGGLLRELVAALQEAEKEVVFCSRCGAVTGARLDPCLICTSPMRDNDLLCVVEDSNDILQIERSGGFRGRYHALLGKLSPMKGDGPGDLRLKALKQRVEQEQVREVILALSTDVEGDATASYVEEMLRPTGVKVSRLAFGLPAGSGIVYSDPITLARAIKGRVPAEV